MTAIGVLQEARDLLLDGWTQGAFARDADGRACPIADHTAVSFDCLGAMVRASSVFPDSLNEAREVFTAALGCDMTYFNDTSSHAEVLAHFSETISTLKASGH